MWTISASEAEGRFKEVIERAEAGEEVTIVRNGKAVARVIAPMQRPSQQTVREAFREIDRLSKGVSLGGQKIKDLIEEGRR